jgi:hypothetical protein
MYVVKQTLKTKQETDAYFKALAFLVHVDPEQTHDHLFMIVNAGAQDRIVALLEVVQKGSLL